MKKFEHAWLQSKPRKWLATYALRMFSGARWSDARATELLTYCGLPDGLIAKELQRRVSGAI